MTHVTTREEQALDTLLRAIIAHRRQRDVGPRRIFGFDELADKALQTQAESDVEDLLDDPVGASHRQAIYRIGKHLFKTFGNTKAMSDVLERVAAMDDANYSRRGSIVDHAWNGIGEQWWS